MFNIRKNLIWRVERTIHKYTKRVDLLASELFEGHNTSIESLLSPNNSLDHHPKTHTYLPPNKFK